MEEWKFIPGFEDYQISSKARIMNLKTGRIITGYLADKGYMRATLSKNGVDTKIYVHQLVALTFLGICPSHHEVNHKNGDKLDNRPVNLEYVTHKENMIHAVKIGLFSRKTKLTENDVLEIRKLLTTGKKMHEIAAIYNVSKSTINNIKAGARWNHV